MLSLRPFPLHHFLSLPSPLFLFSFRTSSPPPLLTYLIYYVIPLLKSFITRHIYIGSIHLQATGQAGITESPLVVSHRYGVIQQLIEQDHIANGTNVKLASVCRSLLVFVVRALLRLDCV